MPYNIFLLLYRILTICVHAAEQEIWEWFIRMDLNFWDTQEYAACSKYCALTSLTFCSSLPKSKTYRMGLHKERILKLASSKVTAQSSEKWKNPIEGPRSNFKYCLSLNGSRMELGSLIVRMHNGIQGSRCGKGWWTLPYRNPPFSTDISISLSGNCQNSN